jgi:phospholipase C
MFKRNKMLNNRIALLFLVFSTGIFYSGNSFCEDNIQSSCRQIIKNPAYPLCNEQNLVDGSICYIDSDKIMPGQTAVGYQMVQAKLHDISKEAGIAAENQINIELENIINFPAPVLLLDKALIPTDYIENTGKLPIILLDAHHRTVALKRWQQSIDQPKNINQQNSYCQLIKIHTDTYVNKELQSIKDKKSSINKTDFWEVLNVELYSDVENANDYSLDFLKMIDAPMRSLFGINLNTENVVADSNVYPNIMKKISPTVNFREFIASKKLLALVNKNYNDANEILNNDKFYSNQETKYYCIQKIREDIWMDTNRKMGKKTTNISYINPAKALEIREHAEDILNNIDIKYIATNWEKENWEDNSVRYKVLKCYMENLHTYNNALAQALNALWRSLYKNPEGMIPVWTPVPNRILGTIAAPTNAKKLTVLQYNIQQRPLLDNGLRNELSTFYLPPAIKQFNADVVTVNEAFTAILRPRLTTEMKKIGYTYATGVLGGNLGSNILGQSAAWSGGVMLFSKYPIETQNEHIFTHFANADQDADKGVLYVQINKDGMKYNIFATHTNASYTFKGTRAPIDDEGRGARSGTYKDLVIDSTRYEEDAGYRSAVDFERKHREDNKETMNDKKIGQFNEIKIFIDGERIPNTEPVIIVGDMNVDMLSEKWQFDSEYDKMLKTLHAIHPKITGIPYTLSYQANEWVNPEDGPIQYLDYVLYSGDHLIPKYSSNRAICLKSDGRYYDTDSCSISQNKIEDGSDKLPDSRRDLSDHFPVLGTFDFNQ